MTEPIDKTQLEQMVVLRRGARRKIELTEDGRNLLRQLGEAGVSRIATAAILGVDPHTLKRMFAEHEDLALLWSEGRAQLEKDLVNTLVEKAHKGDTISLIFALKSIFAYRDVPKDEVTQQTNVQINLPSAMPLEAYMRTVNKPTEDKE